jgi:uncharacterized protein (TIGR02145 family)
LSISCPEHEVKAISSVLTIDASSSMEGLGLELAKIAAKAWIDGLPLGISECCITSFNDGNLYQQDFTTDRQRLYSALNNLYANGTTSYDAGLLDPYAGALHAIEAGKYSKVIVFLTDGYPSQYPLVPEIIQKANDLNVQIYCVTLGMNCHPSLVTIAEETDGEWFGNVTTIEQAQEVYIRILNDIQNILPCTIEWMSEKECHEEFIETRISLKDNSAYNTIHYSTPSKGIMHLDLSKQFINFKGVTPYSTKSETVTVTARNSDFFIQNIISSNPLFDVNPKSFHLNEDESKNIEISFTPVDSNYCYTKLDFELNKCDIFGSCCGGYPRRKVKERTIKLVHPNGNEKFFVGSDTTITWDGVLPEELVEIEYSTNNGLSWIMLEESANGLSYNWHVPNTPSNTCLARVTALSEYFEDYKEILICDQIWMEKNLDVTSYRNGDPIRHCPTIKEWEDAADKQEGAWCYYDNDPQNGNTYGIIYNWYAVNNSGGLAPEGWHIPSKEEVERLVQCLGDSLTAGGKMKTTGIKEDNTGLWKTPNTGASNLSGFSAMPGGLRSIPSEFRFILQNEGAFYWTSSSDVYDSKAFYYWLLYNDEEFHSKSFSKSSGFSVRCIKDK